MKRIVILGGGYAGLLCALTARKFVHDDEADMVLINRSTTHQLVTELHRLAAGNLAEQAVGLPLTRLIEGKRIRLVTGEIARIEADRKQIAVQSQGGDEYSYDYLVIATGSQTAYYNIPGLEQHSLPLKSISDANHIRNHIDRCLERYRRSGDSADAAVIVGGGGLSGIEMAGELADMLPELCRRRGIRPADIKLYCIEALPDILPGFPRELAARARTSLERRGVEFIVGVPVTAYNGRYVALKDGRSLPANTLIWAGGVQGSRLVAQSGIDTVCGRATVNGYLQSVSHENIFAAGDSALFFDDNGQPLPPSAQLACQMGETVGYNLYAAMNGLPLQTFKPALQGKLASLGRKDAVAILGRNNTPLRGRPAIIMKETGKARYLARIRGLHAYLH